MKLCRFGNKANSHGDKGQKYMFSYENVQGIQIDSKLHFYP